MTTPNVVEVHTPTTQVVEVAAIVGPKGDDGAPGAPGGVASVNGQTGDVVLELSSVLAKARKAPAGYWLPAFVWAGRTTTVTNTRTTSHRCPIEAPFDAVAIQLNAVGHYRIGIYDSDDIGMPTNLLADTGEQNADTYPSFRTLELDDPLPAGVYWVALGIWNISRYVASGATPFFGLQGNASTPPTADLLGFNLSSNIVMPDPHPAASGLNQVDTMPLFWVRAASA